MQFAELNEDTSRNRIQTIALQEQPVLTEFSIRKEAGGAMIGVVREFSDVVVDGSLKLSLRTADSNMQTLISGLEVVLNP